MLSIYLFTLCFGGVLVAAGAIGGGGDHDADHGGLDHDAPALGHDGDHDALHPPSYLDHGGDHAAHDATHEALTGAAANGGLSPWSLPFFSLRFWTFGAASFGATGAMLSALGVGEPVAAAIAATVGAGLGSTAAWVFRQLPRDRVSAATTLSTYVGMEARVTLPIGEGERGRIRVTTAAGVTDLPARSGDHRGFTLGERVLIASVVDGVADVTDLPAARDATVRQAT